MCHSPFSLRASATVSSEAAQTVCDSVVIASGWGAPGRTVLGEDPRLQQRLPVHLPVLPCSPGPRRSARTWARRRLCRLTAGAAASAGAPGQPRQSLELAQGGGSTTSDCLLTRLLPLTRSSPVFKRWLHLSRYHLFRKVSFLQQGVIALSLSPSLSPARHAVAAGARLCRCWQRQPATGRGGAPRRWTTASGRCPGWSALSCGPPPPPSRRARPP